MAAAASTRVQSLPLFAAVENRQRLADLLRCCSKIPSLGQGTQVHGSVVKMGFAVDPMIGTDLINMYSKCGRVDFACQVFDRMPHRNVVAWTALMCGYVQRGDAKGSLALFPLMVSSGVRPNEFTLSINLKACGMLNDVDAGVGVHGVCVKSGFDTVLVVGNSIVDMYSKCGRINEAAGMFEGMKVRNLINWNAMIAGYTSAGLGQKALVVFRRMGNHGEIPDEFTFTSLLKACSGLGAYTLGTQIHASMTTSGFPHLIKTTIASALIDLYVKCGKLTGARKVLARTEENYKISGGLILGYAQEGNLNEAMALFRQLREASIAVDSFVLSSMLGVFADLALVEQGKQTHAYSEKIRAGFDMSVCNAVIDMYFKCGLKDEAEKYFENMPKKGVITWTVMITGYGKHGFGREAVSLFDRMEMDHTEPDEVAYLAVLSACSHSGLVEEGKQYFAKLCSDRKIAARVDHYACMVDLLGRAGFLNEARDLISSMPMKPNVGIWQALLSACRLHGDLQLGREVGDILLRLDGNNPVNYVMMSNMYADAGAWNEYERVRDVAKTKKMKKEAGCSWIEINKEIHIFYGGDETHPLSDEIFEVLKEMEKRMKEELGYVYGVRYAMRDVEEESKVDNLRVHSEKLAIGLALVCGGWEEKGRVIRVFKNLRVCGDCHEFIKGLSKILKVVFLVRDAGRFHRFQDGLCSCRDYW